MVITDKSNSIFSNKTVEVDKLSALPWSETHTYLMAWDTILYICENAGHELRSIYINYLTENKHDQVFLNFLIRAMPREVLCHQEPTNGTMSFAIMIPRDDSMNTIDYLRSRITLAVSTVRLISHISSLAAIRWYSDSFSCRLYHEALKLFPAIVRKWWTDLKPRQKSLVDRLTTAYVSPGICDHEFVALDRDRENNESMKLTVHRSTREVRATYSIDDARMELIVQLPNNYPLGVVKVSCGQQVGDKLQSKQIVRQLSIYLTHRNGSIADGLSMWKRNLDRKFEGVEECYVCYSVIHQETYQLPKLKCKTCKKKFHGQCLVSISGILLMFIRCQPAST